MAIVGLFILMLFFTWFVTRKDADRFRQSENYSQDYRNSLERFGDDD